MSYLGKGKFATCVLIIELVLIRSLNNNIVQILIATNHNKK